MSERVGHRGSSCARRTFSRTLWWWTVEWRCVTISIPRSARSTPVVKSQ